MSEAEVPRVVAYRRGTVRFECRDRGLRFSLDKAQLLERLRAIAEEVERRRSGVEVASDAD
jgi:hypothetical protein